MNEEKHIPKVTIIIPVYNQWFMTYNCIESVLKNTDSNINYDILIADDFSDEIPYMDFCELSDRIRLTRNNMNLGFLLNCNIVTKLIECDYFVLLNNDTIVQPGWLTYMLMTIERDKSVGVVGGLLLGSDGRVQEAGGILYRFGAAANYGRNENPEQSNFQYYKEVDYLSFANVLIRKSVWDEIGGFDIRYLPAYCEDSDFCMECRKHGYKVVYQPLVKTIHLEGKSHGTDIKSGLKAFQPINQKKFGLKWTTELESHTYANYDKFRSRDRSRQKECILVVDWMVPQPDQNAGNRTTWQYMEMFIELGLNVKFLAVYQHRLPKYEIDLQQLGVEIIRGTDQEIAEWLMRFGSKIDYVFANRPQALTTIQYIKEYSKAKIIYYGHDLHYFRLAREYQLTRDKNTKKNCTEILKDELKVFSLSDKICYPSIVEKNEIESKGKYKIEVIPAFMYENFEFTDNYASRKDILFVGGFGHSPNLDGLNWFLDEIFPFITDELPDVRLIVAGSNPPVELKQKQSDNLYCTGYIPDKELIELYKNSRVCIVPLRYGAGLKGKVIEAFKYCLPVVSTNIGLEGIELPEITGYDEPESFAKRVIELFLLGGNEYQGIIAEQLNYVKTYFNKNRAKEIMKGLLYGQ